MKTYRILAVLAILFMCIVASVFGESGIYDRIGIISEHGRFGAVPEENIDLFTGNLTLRFLDIHLPGPNGLDLNVWRVYNSKITRDRFIGSAYGIQQEPYSWVGMGWSMHMGRVHNFDQLLPVIEFPDGRMETAWPSINDSYCYTRDFIRYDKVNRKLIFKDGTVWTFGTHANLQMVGGQEPVLLVTRIENSYGQSLTVTYRSGLPVLDQIEDAFGRVIEFISVGTTNPKLDYIRVRDAQGTLRTYDYTVETFSGGYYKLTEYDPPSIGAATFGYNSGNNSDFELTVVNTPYGGQMGYAYSEHTFYFTNVALATRVVTQKRLRFTLGGTDKIWNISYPSYQNAATGTVTVTGPEFNTYTTYHAYNSGSPWKVGWSKKKP